MKKNLFIFNQKIKQSIKLIPFHNRKVNVGKVKYLSPVSREWKNTVYNFNPYNSINFPVFLSKIDYLIKSYFTLRFNPEFIKLIDNKDNSKSITLNRILVSTPEIKHTNTKSIITIYVYNREGLVLLERINKLQRISIKLIKLYLDLKNNSKKILDIPSSKINSTTWQSTLKNIDLDPNLYSGNPQFYFEILRLHKKLNKILATSRRLKLRLSLNKYKFEEKLLYKLSDLLSKNYLNSNTIEFNIVNLKSLTYNSDIITEVIEDQLRTQWNSPRFTIESVMDLIRLPKINAMTEKSRITKSMDFKSFHNIYKNENLIDILKRNINSEDNLNKTLQNIYSTIGSFTLFNQLSYLDLYKPIFSQINFKNIAGIKIKVKGRLTRRYRADRAVGKEKMVGRLNNLDSSLKGLSGTMFRGYLESNIEKSSLNSKRRIGAFGVTSWLSAK